MRIRILSILILEYLVLDDVFVVFSDHVMDLSVNKVVQFGIKETFASKIHFVCTFIHVIILWILFNIGFKVVTVLLFLFS